MVKAATDVSSKQRDKDSILLRHQTPAPSSRAWLALSFISGDLLVISDAPPPPAQNGAKLGLTDSLVKALGARVQRHRPLPNRAYEIKFRGCPWRANGEDTVQQRMVLIALLDVLETYGWSLYTSVQLDPGPEGEQYSGADAWICQKEEGWEEGLPVYHA